MTEFLPQYPFFFRMHLKLKISLVESNWYQIPLICVFLS